VATNGLLHKPLAGLPEEGPGPSPALARLKSAAA